jgi:acetate---CoA ligase (ADP-forming)
MYKILKGLRGQPSLDVNSLAQNLVLLSALMVHCPQIDEVDLNPVRVFPEGQGALALDARIILGEP